MRDWANDFDHFDPTYAADPFSVWDGRREACPNCHVVFGVGIHRCPPGRTWPASR